MEHPYRTSSPPPRPRRARPARLVDLFDRLVVMAAAVLGSSLLFVACTAPSQNDEARFGVWRVGFAGSLDGVYDWRPEQLAQLRAALPLAGALGPTFVEADLLSDADTIVRAAGGLAGACEVFTTADPGVVRVDPTCTAGYPALQQATVHGLAHAYTWNRWHWVGHVCDWPLGAPVPPTCHPTVRCPGESCVLSRGITHPDDGPTFDEAYTGDVADPHPAQPDLDLFAHCRGANACLP